MHESLGITGRGRLPFHGGRMEAKGFLLTMTGYNQAPTLLDFSVRRSTCRGAQPGSRPRGKDRKLILAERSTVRFAYNTGMVLLAENTAVLTTSVLRAHDHKRISSATQPPKSNGLASLRTATYDESFRLGNCSQNPIRYAADSNFFS